MKSVAAILLALCLTHLQDADATVTVYRKSLVVPDKKLALHTESYTDEHLTYALCDNKHPEADEIKCTVVREKKPYDNDTYSCDVTLKRSHVPHHSKYLPHVSVYPFGQKYAALTVWEEDIYLNFTVVQMDNCKVSEAGILYQNNQWEWYDVAVVDHNNTLDMFFNDVDLCGYNVCKVTIGADGLIDEPKPSVIKYVLYGSETQRQVIALDNGSSETGYYFSTRDGNDEIHVLIKSDGTEKSLARHPPLSGTVAVSNTNNLLGVCYQMDGKFECSQYDFDGNLKLNATITRDHTDLIYEYYDIYNLPNGGFYLFSVECKIKQNGDCGGEFWFLAERVEANGKKTGYIIFQGLGKSFNVYGMRSPPFYKEDSKQVCFSLSATRNTGVDRGQIELFANCFTDAEFSRYMY